jgi:hypothetical protein
MWHVWGREVHTGFWWGYLGERDQLEDLGVGGRIILKRIPKTGWGVMDWIDLVQDRDWWWALVNAVMNFWFP